MITYAPHTLAISTPINHHIQRTMRTKSTPTSSIPRKRVRHNPHRIWAHAEWFQSHLDTPYFSHSDFLYVLTTALSLPPLFPPPPTRLQLSRIRAAMCHAFPGGFATPRRFSKPFLQAELAELHMYRQDARSIIRGGNLQHAVDPTTQQQLPDDWWSRYRCPPPLPPQRHAALLIRTFLPPPTGNNQLLLDPPFIRPAVFLSLEAPSSCRIRFSDDQTEHTVSDLDLMLPPAPPTTTNFSFSPLPDFDLSRIEAPSHLLDLYSSPRPVIISPQRPLYVGSHLGPDVECELDFQQTAESMRLLDTKQQLLYSLRDLNDLLEKGDATNTDQLVHDRYAHTLTQLETVNSQLHHIMQPQLCTPNPNPSNPFASPLGPPIPQPKFDTTPESQHNRESPQFARNNPSNPSNETTSTAPMLRPEHLAKNVDFQNATGATLLARALTRTAFANLPPNDHLTNASMSIRADVMECISCCVAVLIRARATRDFHCIEELIDNIRVRFPENAEAINAIHQAATNFDLSSSTSM